MDANKLTKAFVRIRDARAAIKAEFDRADSALKEKSAKLEGAMMAILHEQNVESIRTADGTFYRHEDIIPQGEDWAAFYAWVREHDAFEALDRRIKKSFIKEHMEAHDGSIPPGVRLHREFVVRVRRS